MTYFIATFSTNGHNLGRQWLSFEVTEDNGDSETVMLNVK